MSYKASDYINKGSKFVNGWLLKEAMQIVQSLDQVQKELNLHGTVGEIGVHHGKFFILLHLLCKAGEKSLALDLFEQQEENLDKSGKGNKEILMANLRKFDCRLENINIITVNSLEINSSQLLEFLTGEARFFSIDGGHTADITFCDLENVSGVMCDGGIIVIDDYFNSLWPGVSEGVWRFLNKYPNAIYPIAIGGNKIFFTNKKEYVKQYQKGLLKINITEIKKSEFNSEEVLLFIFRGKYTDFLARTQWWENVKNTAFGELLKNIYRKFRC